MSSSRHSRALTAVFAIPLLLVGGCSSLSNTEKGAMIGAGAGAAGGAVVGNAAGGTAEGALLGAVAGGAAGAIIGRQMDSKADELDHELENAEIERVGEGITVTFDSGLLFDFDFAPRRPNALATGHFSADFGRRPEKSHILGMSSRTLSWISPNSAMLYPKRSRIWESVWDYENNRRTMLLAS